MISFFIRITVCPSALDVSFRRIIWSSLLPTRWASLMISIDEFVAPSSTAFSTWFGGGGGHDRCWRGLTRAQNSRVEFKLWHSGTFMISKLPSVDGRNSFRKQSVLRSSAGRHLKLELLEAGINLCSSAISIQLLGCLYLQAPVGTRICEILPNLLLRPDRDEVHDDYDSLLWTIPGNLIITLRPVAPSVWPLLTRWVSWAWPIQEVWRQLHIAMRERSDRESRVGMVYSTLVISAHAAYLSLLGIWI